MSASVPSIATPHGDVVIRRYAQSRHLKLYQNSHGQFVLSAPKYVPMFEIERFLLGHLETLQHWRSQRFAVEHHATLNHLKLCVSQCHCTDGLRVTLSDDMIESLRHSLKKQAKTILSERLRLWSETMNTGYSSLRLGFPKSRWGSCSSSGTISLSCMLVSVDQPLQDYVIIHELSHVQHMHHRQSFWQHVERYDPNYKLHRSKLKNLRSHI